ncbi:MAG TPA: hypothetical protein VIQ11_00645 [Mycobacterium sp.]
MQDEGRRVGHRHRHRHRHRRCHEAADNTLISGFLAVIAAIRLSRATKRDIPQNRCWP